MTSSAPSPVPGSAPAAARAAQAWSSLVGPLGRSESLRVLGGAACSALVIGGRTSQRRGPARGTVVAALALDLIGGLIAFQYPVTRQRYSAHSRRSRLTFALVHVQPFVLPLIGEGSWRQAGRRYVAAVASTAGLEYCVADSSRRRWIANGVAGALSLADLTSGEPGQRWFGPVFLMKVIGGHGSIRGNSA